MHTTSESLRAREFQLHSIDYLRMSGRVKFKNAARRAHVLTLPADRSMNVHRGRESLPSHARWCCHMELPAVTVQTSSCFGTTSCWRSDNNDNANGHCGVRRFISNQRSVSYAAVHFVWACVMSTVATAAAVKLHTLFHGGLQTSRNIHPQKSRVLPICGGNQKH
jgi:hypothetical protein